MEKLTFEQLPEAVALLLEKINRIEKLLSGGKASETPLKTMLTINESAEYLGVSLSSTYKLTHRRVLPIYKPSGGKVYIKRDDLVTYMNKNRLSKPLPAFPLIDTKAIINISHLYRNNRKIMHSKKCYHNHSHIYISSICQNDGFSCSVSYQGRNHAFVN